MIGIALLCRTSEVLAGPKVIGRAQGEVDRGWQDKSADGCRAHVVGGVAIFVTLGPQRAGSCSEKHKGINDAEASHPQKGEKSP
jgi:hypothetical protein